VVVLEPGEAADLPGGPAEGVLGRCAAGDLRIDEITDVRLELVEVVGGDGSLVL